METSRKQILIVDSNPKDTQLLGVVLRNLGYSVSFADNARQALEIVDEKKPDLILLEIFIPEIDGYQLCRQLKQTEETCDVPVIFVSAGGDTFEIIRAFEAGASDYIHKPVHTEDLLVKINTHLNAAYLQSEIAHLQEMFEGSLRLRTKTIYEEKNTELSAAEARTAELEVLLKSLSRALKRNVSTINCALPSIRLAGSNSADSVDAQVVESLATAAASLTEHSQALNEFSLASTDALSPAQCDLTSISRKLVASYRLDEPPNKVSADIQIGLRTIADPSLMEIMLKNLIARAWKSSSIRPDGYICVGSFLSKAGSVFFVEDNGGGFSLSRANRLIDLYNKSDQDAESVAYALNLATVQKIIERHHGQIWAEGSEDEGSRICFMIPEPETPGGSHW